MYGAFWRALPGPVWLKVLLVVVLVCAVVLVLFEWVFPAIAPHLPIDQQTVETE